jgi:CheY-like chemotaxis protein
VYNQLSSILIVEDEFDSLQMISKVLTHHGLTIHVAHNGRECLEMLRHIEPSLVVTDLAMPEMDGWEMLVEMRSNPNTAHIPVVAITAYHSQNVADDVVRAGFDAYFPKPVNPKTFVENLSRIMAG